MHLILVESFLAPWPCLVCLHQLQLQLQLRVRRQHLFGQLFLLVLSPLFHFSILLGLFRLLDEGYRCRCILRNASGVIISVGTMYLNTSWGIVRWVRALVGEASLARWRFLKAWFRCCWVLPGMEFGWSLAVAEAPCLELPMEPPA